MQLQNLSIYYAKYKKEESTDGTNKRRRSGTGNHHRRKNVNMRRNVTLEHCFGGEEMQETTKRRKTPRWILISFKERRRNYMKGKIY